MYDSFDNTYQVSHKQYLHSRKNFAGSNFTIGLKIIFVTAKNKILELKLKFNLQATIGIDFLSKTMYLEDRTVRLQLWVSLV